MSFDDAVADLSEYNKENILKYIRYARIKRDQHMKEVDLVFDDMRDGLYMDSYSTDEVAGVLGDAQNNIRSALQTELLAQSQVVVAVMKQMFMEADKHSVSLFVDTSSLEDRSVLDQMKRLENAAFGAGTASSRKLDSIGSQKGLVEENQSLKDELEQFRDRFAKLQAQCTDILKEKSNMTADIRRLEEDLQDARSGIASGQGQVQQMQSRMADMQHEQGQLSQLSAQEVNQLRAELSNCQMALQRQNQEVDELNNQLAGRVNDTRQFKQLKDMITKKNDQVRDLRERLRRYEPDEE
eukprot:GFYU01007985.1.p1 GENE.GFYU01007985.1~~GFYU01007985.1.p1  ORF type:complete len:297 (+),score=85.95 GFYU01007985.1:69-959(+)